MGLINISNQGELKIIKNSMEIITTYPALRIDTHFLENMSKAESFFKQDIRWTKLGYLIDNIFNGENLGTEWYSVDGDSKILYLSVSQVTEFGLEEKNNNYLKDEILDEKFGKARRKVALIEKDMIIVTRSGTPGISVSSNHPTFDYDIYDYVPSGFLIYFTLRKDLKINPNIITYYLNLRPIRYYLIANSSGRCQRNISQEILMDLPVPENILTQENQIEILEQYKLIEKKAIETNRIKREANNVLNNIWEDAWQRFSNIV